MDVQKQDDLIKEAFEIEAEEIGFCLDQLWGDYENPYENSDTALAFNLFKKGWLAKAQAVPDVQQALNDRLLVRSIKEQVESHIAEISVNDLFDKGWFAAMKCIQSNIDMLEAQEQSHE